MVDINSPCAAGLLLQVCPWFCAMTQNQIITSYAQIGTDAVGPLNSWLKLPTRAENSCCDSGSSMMRDVAIKAAPPGKWPKLVEQKLLDGANVNTRDKGSNTMMIRAASMKPIYSEFMAEVVDTLLQKKADPNLMNFEGLTALHALNGGSLDRITASCMWHSSTEVGVQQMITNILADPRTDPCIGDATPLMRAVAMNQHAATISLMLPKIKWEQIEAEMKKPFQEGCAGLATLLRTTWNMDKEPIDHHHKQRKDEWSGVKKLELRNHLGIAATGDKGALDQLKALARAEGMGKAGGPNFAASLNTTEEELQRRRKDVAWEFLKKSLAARVNLGDNKFSKEEAAIELELWQSTGGVTWFGGQVQDARTAYLEGTTGKQAILNQVLQDFAKQLEPEFDRMSKDTHGKTITGMQETTMNVAEKKELWHGRFWNGQLPDCFVKQNMKEAAQELASAGAIEFAEDLSKILSQGMDPGGKLVKPFKPFTDESSPEFWLGLVVLWLLAKHNSVKEAFENAMLGFADGNIYDDKDEKTHKKGEFMKAPIKKFERIMVKTKEYIVERGLKDWQEVVYAPLCVIDILRCTFLVDSEKRFLEIAKKIEDNLPTVRIKNSFSTATKDAKGGYRDRKYNSIYSHNGVSLMVEIQMTLKSFKKVAKKMHRAYSADRGDFDKGGVQVGPEIKWSACLPAKILNSRACCGTKVYSIDFNHLIEGVADSNPSIKPYDHDAGSMF